MKKLKVLIVTADYPPPTGGIQIFTFELEKELLKAGHAVKVLNFDGRNVNTYQYLNWRDFFYTEATKNSYFPLHKILNPTNLFKISGGLRDFVYKNMVYRVTRQAIKEFKPDLVHVMKNELYSAVFNLSVPYIVSCHSSGNDIYDAEHITYSLQHAAKVHCVSNYSKSLVQSLVHRKDQDLIVIYNFIDLRKYKKNSIMYKENRIITISRMTKGKNINTLIKAFSLLPSELKDTYKYYIVGSGAEFENLKKLAKRLDLHNIVFKGEITDEEEKIKLLSESKIFLLCSTEETFGIVFIEAHALGLPVICYATGGVPEAAGKGGLYVNNEKDPKEIAEKIELLMRDTVLYDQLVLEIRKRIHQFDKEVWFQKICEMYEKVLEAKQ